MKFFIDTANLKQIQEAQDLSILHGVTTNPTLMAKAGITDYLGFAKEVLSQINEKSISFEVFSDEINEMYDQAMVLKDLGENDISEDSVSLGLLFLSDCTIEVVTFSSSVSSIKPLISRNHPKSPKKIIV